MDVSADWEAARDWLGTLMAYVRGEAWNPAAPDGATEAKTILARYRGLACGARHAEALKAVRPASRAI